mmetsp:Transcript_75460/g.245460  ORF Transcript_75460/g.245460 Transcript_75460/m.245460 type:complete len:248 (-) Transcript_75460:1289-2032(-)
MLERDNRADAPRHRRAGIVRIHPQDLEGRGPSPQRSPGRPARLGSVRLRAVVVVAFLEQVLHRGHAIRIHPRPGPAEGTSRLEAPAEVGVPEELRDDQRRGRRGSCEVVPHQLGAVLVAYTAISILNIEKVHALRVHCDNEEDLSYVLRYRVEVYVDDLVVALALASDVVAAVRDAVLFDVLVVNGAQVSARAVEEDRGDVQVHGRLEAALATQDVPSDAHFYSVNTAVLLSFLVPEVVGATSRTIL